MKPVMIPVRALVLTAAIGLFLGVSSAAWADPGRVPDSSPPPSSHPPAAHAPSGRPPGPGFARRGNPAGYHGGPRHDFRGRDFHQLSPGEQAEWQHGRWHHNWHGHRLGWWWDAGGFWYFYPAPLYPYPDMIASDDVEPAPEAADQAGQDQDQPDEDQDQAPQGAQDAGPAPMGSWYYCPASKSYYPYVHDCAGGWQEVPAKPPGAP